MNSDLPRLSRSLLAARGITDGTLDLPEKVVQFGTGALLRGLIETAIDDLNRRGSFGGRVVAVGSTGSGRDRKLNEQNGLFTLAVRGIEDGQVKAEYRLITALSRALSATNEWDAVLACAREAAIELVFSNTTETGIRLDETDRLGPGAPKSFPGKLTAFLLERARYFDYARDRGVVVLPCELIENNGDRLKETVLALARLWSLGDDFAAWLEEAVPFCNTLVDRIVPGEPEPDARGQAWRELDYTDELLTVAEPYRLLAIEARGAVADRLPFSSADDGIVVADDITPYRQRKVRLLNGTHTISTPLALLAGCQTVRGALEDDRLGAFMRRVLFGELVPSTSVADAEAFAGQVLDRFANPYVRHALLDITLQQTMKMRVRIVPAILDYAKRFGKSPDAMALGFAAYLLYLRDAGGEARADDLAEAIRAHWRRAHGGSEAVAVAVCADANVWGSSLANVSGFAARVAEHLDCMLREGVGAAVDRHLAVSARA